MGLGTKQRDEIRRVLEKFLRDRARTIRKLKIDDLNLNPFLIRLLSAQMGLEDAGSIVRWLVSQRLERGTVTSFGKTLESIAKLFSEGTGAEGADVVKTKDAVRHYVQVKSGPNTIDKDAGIIIARQLKSAQRRNRGSVALFGMCYGTKEQVSGIVRQYVDSEGGVDWKSGREFWEFISDSPGCIDEIYETGTKVGREFEDIQGQSIVEILDAKIRGLTREFELRYGKRGKAMWRRILDINS